MTLTFAPRCTISHAHDNPKIPAPRTVTSTVAIPPALAHGPLLYPAALGHVMHSDQSNASQPPLEWRASGVPVSPVFNDPYYSLDDGLAETQHVFLAGNNLPERLCDGFHVAELGFGTGLNLLALLALWRETGIKGRLHYTGFEAFPMQKSEAERALAPFFPELGALVTQAWNPQGMTIDTPDLYAQVIIGDARQTLPTWHGAADAWFLDGFSPAKNPELWEPALLNAVAAHTAKAGSFATYSAAGAVRRALSEAGFHVERRVGYGRKRHMSIGTLSR
jgi:tRNA U34 5-methylaminomethyl-2-thiouridine-forming methyltransferase MnmC